MSYKVYTVDEIFIKVTNTHPRVNGFCGMYEYGGIKYWAVDEKYHRVGAPAIECVDGTKYWYIDGKLHRLDGPAIELFDGTNEWYIDGKQVTEKQCKLLHDIMKLKGLI